LIKADLSNPAMFGRDYYFDNSKFNKRFSFTPTSPEEGIREMVG
jgi:nucleoside-diphosphate-sugar epimerase